MTKKEIVKSISDKTGLTQLQIKEIVQLTFDGIIETLLDEGRVELRNFGVFQVKSRKARKARNPRTGRQVDVPEKFVVAFKPGKEMEERVKVLEEAKARAKAEALAAEQARQQAAQSTNHQPANQPPAAQQPPYSSTHATPSTTPIETTQPFGSQSESYGTNPGGLP
ncbi:MAG: integration host factor subunit beta [Planctomycetales bacterium]|nr:integration host factor subunit beta [Planctomycetales bacterium]